MLAMSVGVHAATAFAAYKGASDVAEVNPDKSYDEQRKKSIADSYLGSPAEEEVDKHAES